MMKIRGSDNDTNPDVGFFVGAVDGVVTLEFNDVDPYMGGSITINPDEWKALVEMVERSSR